jgi:hypothetical protein
MEHIELRRSKGRPDSDCKWQAVCLERRIIGKPVIETWKCDVAPLVGEHTFNLYFLLIISVQNHIMIVNGNKISAARRGAAGRGRGKYGG